RDERHLVRHLEQRDAPLFRLVDDRLRQVLVLEPRSEPKPGDIVVGEQGHEAALPSGPIELDPGRQEQLAARQPRRWILELGDVDPADGALGVIGPGGQLETAGGYEAAYRQHRTRSADGRRPTVEDRSRRARAGVRPLVIS